MDDCDRAAKYQQDEIDAALSRREDEGPIVANGTCWNCLAPVGPRQKYCDGECADEHSRDLALQRRAGR